MKKLLILHPYLAPYRIDLYNQLAKDYRVMVLLYGNEKEKKTLGYNLQSVEDKATFDIIKAKGILYIGRHLLSTVYYRVIRKFRPDAILCHELGINTLAVIWMKKLFGYKVYTTIDDSPSMAISYGKKREKLRHYVLSRIDGALVVSPEVQHYLEEKYADLSCKYLFFPIIQNDEILHKNINRASNLATNYIQQHHLENKKIILFVGRQIEIKRPHLLVKIFAEINDPNSALILVGGGILEPQIREFILQNKLQSKIIQTGVLSGEHLYAWYNLAHLFVLPSSFEPFGAVVNEALIAGCRVLISDCVGAKSLISTTNGSIFKTNSVDSFKEFLIKEISYINTSKNCCSKMNKTFFEYYKDLTGFIR